MTWTSLNTNIIAVLRGGVISVIDLGSTYINARLGNQIGVALITATSPGTHTVYGRVREPGRGGLGFFGMTKIGPPSLLSPTTIIS